MKAVILAGGFGTRFSEETDSIPKPMIEIGGRPILWHIMKIYIHWGINEFIICLGYKGYVIKEYFANYFLHMSDLTFDIENNSMQVHRHDAEPWKVTVVDTGLRTMTGGRLKRIRPYINDETFCMTYGDGLSNVDIKALVAFHRAHHKLATVTAVRPPGRFGVLQIEHGAVRDIREKPETLEALINAGFFVLEPAALDSIDNDDTGWEGGAMGKLAQAGELMPFVHTGFWQPMDTLREKRTLDEMWETGRAPWMLW